MKLAEVVAFPATPGQPNAVRNAGMAAARHEIPTRFPRHFHPTGSGFASCENRARSRVSVVSHPSSNRGRQRKLFHPPLVA
ncbi:hypothetical protein SBA3_2730016 [Candidatus Sulfopaludibacter sp. SbA3]|nr:hypothetical protein SBA3_2730016 [Candidatus Sulfopaludibacter sp. SbA3]